MKKIKVGIVGARGFVAGEFLGLLLAHPALELSFIASKNAAGAPVDKALPALAGQGLTFVSSEPEEVLKHKPDLILLGMPNGIARDFVKEIPRGKTKILDLSSDHRFDPEWVYGLPELNREALKSADLVANPGCYATAAQLALAPFKNQLKGTPVIFGLSGFSGAGKSPSTKNDPEHLKENVIPYSLTGHGHEKEISAGIGHDVSLIPHVGNFFRGISLTISFETKDPQDAEDLMHRARNFYAGESFISLAKGIPEIRNIVGTPLSCLGGFKTDARNPHRVVMVSVLDNLLKGAASQAMQNLNLMFGFNEKEGIFNG